MLTSWSDSKTMVWYQHHDLMSMLWSDSKIIVCCRRCGLISTLCSYIDAVVWYRYYGLISTLWSYIGIMVLYRYYGLMARLWSDINIIVRYQHHDLISAPRLSRTTGNPIYFMFPGASSLRYVTECVMGSISDRWSVNNKVCGQIGGLSYFVTPTTKQ